MENITFIKQNIKKELAVRSISIYTLCKSMGVNRNYISRITIGTPISKIIRIAREIGCSPKDLLKGIE